MNARRGRAGIRGFAPAADREARIGVAVLCAATAILGAIAVFAVPAGLPYDEPAHWADVLYLAQHRALPVVGDPGVTYEGQQAPAYYAIAALLVGVFGSGPAGFIAVRLFGVVGGVLMTWLVARLLGRALPGRPAAIVAGTASVALNPMLLVMSASVQNDTWSLVAGFAAVLVALGTGGGPWIRGAALGVLAALAILAKITTAPLIAGVLVVLLVRARWREAIVATLVIVPGCGWWVLRNLALYGDLTGQAGVEAAGYRFGSGGATPFALAREALTYLTLPDEYLRNVFHAPIAVDALAVLIGLLLIAGAVALCTVGRRSARALPVAMLAVVGAVSVVAWLAQVALGWHVAFRTAYGVLPLAALAYGSATLWARGRRMEWILCALCALILLALCGWTGIQLAAVSDRVMLRF